MAKHPRAREAGSGGEASRAAPRGAFGRGPDERPDDAPDGRPSRGSPGGVKTVARVLVLADGSKPRVGELAAELGPWLSARVPSVAVELAPRAYARRRAAAAADRREDPDLLVVLGGDGAILGAVRTFADAPVPTLGINFGRVGFLASTEVAEWREALGEVLEGRALVEPRMRLEAELAPRHGEPIRAVALNDVVLTRGAYQGMLAFALKVGDEWVTNYRADGLIVATPSGSTAYSLAAGGPILAPTMDAFVVTPISPQALAHRPIVLPPGRELSLVLSRASGLTTLVVDGQGFYTLHVGDSLVVRRHPVAYPLLARPGLDPYKRLRDRLGWRGSNEPDVFPPETGEGEHGPEAVEGGVL